MHFKKNTTTVIHGTKALSLFEWTDNYLCKNAPAAISRLNEAANVKGLEQYETQSPLLGKLLKVALYRETASETSN